VLSFINKSFVNVHARHDSKAAGDSVYACRRYCRCVDDVFPQEGLGEADEDRRAEGPAVVKMVYVAALEAEGEDRDEPGQRNS